MKIYNSQWETLQTLQTVLNSREVKNNLVDEISSTLQEKYFSRSKGVKQALDKMCFLAKEKGFAFASPKYYMEKFDIKKDAIYTIVKEMIGAGIVTRCNRSSSKQNGLGGWVIIFHSHPNFEAISNILNLKEKAEQNAEPKAENVESLTAPTVSEDNQVPTFSLPVTTSLKKENVKPLNVEETVPTKETFKIIKYVPKAINKLYASIFDVELTDIWRKVTQAVKSIGFTISKEDVFNFGRIAIDSLFKRIKKVAQKGITMPLDEMCAYVYVTMRSVVYNAVGQGFVDDMLEEDEVYYYPSVDAESGFVKTQYPSYDSLFVDFTPTYVETKKETVKHRYDQLSQGEIENILRERYEDYDDLPF